MNNTVTNYPPLETVTSPTIGTNHAAYVLNRKAQTLRGWACSQSGPIRPININGRLAWPVNELRELTGVAA